MAKEPGHIGRPRSESARAAVLHAVDDLLVEQGYAAMTMKGIAQRAGVSRQTIYRWWSTKAEILFEASWIDAAEELAVAPAATPLAEVAAYLEALVRFLTRSPAGAAYRALLGEAQHDRAVADLIASRDFVGDSAKAVIVRAIGPNAAAAADTETDADADAAPDALDAAAARLVGPTFFWILSGHAPTHLNPHHLAEEFLTGPPASQPTKRPAKRPGTGP